MTEKRSIQLNEIIARIRYSSILCVIGVLINIMFIFFTIKYKAPIRLGTVGTISVSILGGYLPGVIVGFVTNILYSIRDYNMMSYGFLEMLIAVITNILAKRGYFEKFYKAVLTIPVFVAITGALKYLVSFLIGRKESAFNVMMMWQFVDIGISVLIVFITIKILSDKFGINKRSAEIVDKHKVKSRLMSIRWKILIMLSMICVLIATAITSISYMQYRDEMIQNHIKLGRGAIQLIREKLDPDRVDDFIEHGYTAVGYYSVENYLYDLRNNLPDAEFIYVYKMMHTGIFVVFDTDTDEFEADEPGAFIEYEPVLKKLRNQFLAGNEIEPTISNDEYGFLLSVYEPLIDRKGEVVCYACVDFSMDVLNRYIAKFIIRIIMMFIGFVILIFALFIKLMEINIIMPVNEMSYCASKFSYNNEEERQSNIEMIKELNIRTGDEIENLYFAFCKTVEDGMFFADNLRRARNQVMTMAEQVSQISVTAYTDSLTGVKNKAAYQKISQDLENDIDNNQARFAIVMIDINRLKQVNDTYGHEKGDLYIKGSCKMICDIFKHSPVYRFGGDEFVVVLKGDSYEEREELVEKARDAFNKSGGRVDLQPWERYSAATGMSEYKGELGERVDNVFKRADKNMYDYKIKMKAQRTE